MSLGLWVLLDLKLYPEDQKTSAWASLVSSINFNQANDEDPFKPPTKFLKPLNL